MPLRLTVVTRREVSARSQPGHTCPQVAFNQ